MSRTLTPRRVLPPAPPLPFSSYVASVGAYLKEIALQPETVFWVGCHGGAGTSCLSRATGLGIDGGRAWPNAAMAGQWTNVVLVARGTASGTWAATGAVEQWREKRVPPGTRLLGLVVVAGTPNRPPQIVAERMRLLAGWVPAVWQIGWQDVYVAVEDPCVAGPAPDIQALRRVLERALRIQKTSRDR